MFASVDKKICTYDEMSTEELFFYNFTHNISVRADVDCMMLMFVYFVCLGENKSKCQLRVIHMFRLWDPLRWS